MPGQRTQRRRLPRDPPESGRLRWATLSLNGKFYRRLDDSPIVGILRYGLFIGKGKLGVREANA
jgi:hypothetical protein